MRGAQKIPAETIVASLAAAGLALHLAMRLAGVSPAISRVPLWCVLAAGTPPLMIAMWRKALAREVGADFLAVLSITASAFLLEPLAGAIIVLMLSGGHSLELLAGRRARAVLDVLAQRMPTIAHRRDDTGVHEVPMDQVAVGDWLTVFPHESCPVDGVVVEGHGRMDESYLTGEPFQIAKTPGTRVLSGALNGDTVLTIRAEKPAKDSRYAKIMEVMREAEEKRPSLRRLGDRLGAWYAPFAVGVAGSAWILSGQPERFLAVLVIATPCPLLIAIPVAVIGAISLAARRGIVIKNPAALEQLQTCRTLIFDKTGTLTYGEPVLTKIICAPGFSKNEVLRWAASLEQYSRHPLAGAVSKAAQEAGLPVEPAVQVSEKAGRGLAGTVAGRSVEITSRSNPLSQAWPLPPAAGGLECLVAVDGAWAAIFRFRDAPRRESRPFIGHLYGRHGIRKVMLISGDRQSEVEYLAQAVGISDVHYETSPEEKMAIVQEERRRSPTIFVGDGINDAPALMSATVGIAFGPKSDITSEAAAAVVLDSSLERMDELLHIGRRMRKISLQSAVGGMGLSLIGMLAAASGHLSPVTGAILQEVIDLLAILNAVRMASTPRSLSDFFPFVR